MKNKKSSLSRLLALVFAFAMVLSCTVLPASATESSNSESSLFDPSIPSYTVSASDLEPVEGAIPPVSRNENQLYKDEDGAKIAFIALDGSIYEEVVFTLGKADDGWFAYWFLTEMPTKGQPVSYAGDQTDRYSAGGYKDAPGKEIRVDIPDDAKVFAVYYSDPGLVYCPESFTFINNDPAAEAPVDIEMLAGAEARIAAKSGLRFTTRIPTAQLEALAAAGTEYTVGTLIYPTDMLDGALTVETEGALNLTGATPKVDAEEAGYTYFYAAIVDILAQNYARAFSAVSYIKIGDDYYYTDYSEENNSRSIYEVAYAANAAAPSADLQFFFNGIVEIKDGAVVTPAGYTSAFAAEVVDGYIVIEKGANNWADLHAVIVDGVVYTSGWANAGEEFMGKLPAKTPLDYLQDNSLATYSYPMETLTPVEGAIPPVSRNENQLYTDEDGAKIVFIDISGIAFEKMTLVRGKDDDGWGAYWFLTEMPTKGEPVSYAGNQTDRNEIYNAGAGTTTSEISIPDDAKVLAFYYSDPGCVYCPTAITFLNSDAE